LVTRFFKIFLPFYVDLFIPQLSRFFSILLFVLISLCLAFCVSFSSHLSPCILVLVPSFISSFVFIYLVLNAVPCLVCFFLPFFPFVASWLFMPVCSPSFLYFLSHYLCDYFSLVFIPYISRFLSFLSFFISPVYFLYFARLSHTL
jgi:hypothetical protein